MVSAAVAAAAGAWLLAAPLVLTDLSADAATRVVSNDLAVGAVITSLAVVRMLRPWLARPTAWVNAAVGLWLVAAPFALAYDLPAATFNDVAVGATVLLAALVGLAAARGEPPRGRAEDRDARERVGHGSRNAFGLAVVLLAAVVAIAVFSALTS